MLVERSQNVWLQLELLVFLFLGLLLIAFKENLDGVNAERNELAPGNLSIWILIRERQ